MHVVPMRVVDLAEGNLPPVCILTGVPADEFVQTSWFVTPSWILIGLPLGVVPYFVLRSMYGRQIDGLVPVSHAVIKDVTRLRRIRTAAVVLGVIGLVAGLAFDEPFGFVGGITALAAATGAGIYGSFTWVGALPGDFPGEILLTRVSPEFARAAGRLEGKRRRESPAS